MFVLLLYAHACMGFLFECQVLCMHVFLPACMARRLRTQCAPAAEFGGHACMAIFEAHACMAACAHGFLEHACMDTSPGPRTLHFLSSAKSGKFWLCTKNRWCQDPIYENSYKKIFIIYMLQCKKPYGIIIVRKGKGTRASPARRPHRSLKTEYSTS